MGDNHKQVPSSADWFSTSSSPIKQNNALILAASYLIVMHTPPTMLVAPISNFSKVGKALIKALIIKNSDTQFGISHMVLLDELQDLSISHFWASLDPDWESAWG